MKRKTISLFVILIILNLSFYLNAESNLNSTDINYLKDLYKATYNCLSYFVYEKTGMPYDVSNYKVQTSTTNIGLYLASTAIAGKTGLLTEEDAINKINTTLTSLEKIEKWKGFPITWVNVETLKQEYDSNFSYADHIGNLVSCLEVVSSIYPEKFSKRIKNYINAMDFGSCYEPSNGWLKGGYDSEKKDFCVNQSWGKWYYNLVASDQRTFILIGIALYKIPGSAWAKWDSTNNLGDKLDKEIITKIFSKNTSTAPYLYPGMQGGGLFMQYLPGIFISEQNLSTGISAKNFSWCQIEFSKKNSQYPFWGMSACESPDGKSYIGWASMKKDVITPHASILAIADYDKDTIANLYALDKAGARLKYKDKDGKEHDFGFTDSYSTTTKESSKNYLYLDQSMLFLSLANYLFDGIVHKSFNDSPIGKKVNKVIAELDKKNKPLNLRDWQ